MNYNILDIRVKCFFDKKEERAFNHFWIPAYANSSARLFLLGKIRFIPPILR